MRDGNRMNLAGERVRERQDELDLTRTDLAGRLADQTDAQWNLEFPEVQRLEYGQRIISDLELLALGRALDGEHEWLLTGKVAYTPRRRKPAPKDGGGKAAIEIRWLTVRRLGGSTSGSSFIFGPNQFLRRSFFCTCRTD